VEPEPSKSTARCAKPEVVEAEMTAVGAVGAAVVEVVLLVVVVEPPPPPGGVHATTTPARPIADATSISRVLMVVPLSLRTPRIPLAVVAMVMVR
jgi:hypothetical protein